MSRPLLAVTMAALMLTAGCSFLGGGGTPTADTDEPTPTGTPTATATPTATETPSPTPTPTTQYPAGYGADGVENATAAGIAHTEALLDRDSFIVAINGSVLADNRTASVQQLQSVDLVRGRALVAVNDSERVERVTYFANGTRYARVAPPDGNVSYNATDAPLQPRTFTGISFIGPALTNVTYGEANVTETDEGTFYGYRAASVNRSAFRNLLGPSVDPENVTDFDAGFVVEDGIVRRLSYQAAVERGNETIIVDVRLRTYAVDEVEVSPPPWLDEARESDS